MLASTYIKGAAKRARRASTSALVTTAKSEPTRMPTPMMPITMPISLLRESFSSCVRMCARKMPNSGAEAFRMAAMPPVARDCPHTIRTNGATVLKIEKSAKWRHSASDAGMR